MSQRPPSNSPDDVARLQRCVRDFAALHALPSMCIGCSGDDTLRVVLDALPTVLGCCFVCLELPHVDDRHGSLEGAPLTRAELDELASAGYADGTDAVLTCRGRRIWCLQLDVPVGAARGRLLLGRDTPLDGEIDRVLFRSAANMVGTTLETANVLDAARRKDDFIAMLGHELRNPLASIMTAVEILSQRPAVAREHQVIERHTRHLTRLVDDLLDVSRITRGQLDLRSEDVALATVLERASELAEPLFRRHGHTVHLADAGDITINGDTVRLVQIFGNLLTNAAKFTPEHGEVRVSVERIGDRVRVAVKDNGRGIDRPNLARIFEPFVQVDRNRDTVSNGLGLGLAIVRMLVERHRGTITVESAGLGHGATFVVQLPTVAPPSRAVAPARTNVPTSARAGLRILLVDDNRDIADLMQEALAVEGFETAAAHDGHTALERWRTFAPHVAVLDVGLPDVDGYELARAIRAEHGSGPTLIAATGYGQQADRDRALAAGFDLHLVKPVSLAALVRVLDETATARMRNPRNAPDAHDDSTA